MTTTVRNSREVPPSVFFFFFLLLFPSLPPLLLPSLSLSLSLLKTVAQPTFIRDHGTPELELHVRKKRFYAATRNESVVNTEPLSLSVFETFLKIAKISGEGQQWPIKRNGKDNDEVVGEIALRIRSLRRIIFVKYLVPFHTDLKSLFFFFLFKFSKRMRINFIADLTDPSTRERIGEGRRNVRIDILSNISTFGLRN